MTSFNKVSLDPDLFVQYRSQAAQIVKLTREHLGEDQGPISWDRQVQEWKKTVEKCERLTRGLFLLFLGLDREGTALFPCGVGMLLLHIFNRIQMEQIAETTRCRQFLESRIKTRDLFENKCYLMRMNTIKNYIFFQKIPKNQKKVVEQLVTMGLSIPKEKIESREKFLFGLTWFATKIERNQALFEKALSNFLGVAYGT